MFSKTQHNTREAAFSDAVMDARCLGVSAKNITDLTFYFLTIIE